MYLQFIGKLQGVIPYNTKQASTCSKSATKTPEQDSKYVLSPKIDRTTYHS